MNLRNRGGNASAHIDHAQPRRVSIHSLGGSPSEAMAATEGVERAIRVRLHLGVWRNLPVPIEVPAWERRVDGQRLVRLRCGPAFPLLAVTDDLQRRIWLRLGLSVVLTLKQTCQALRRVATGLLCDAEWQHTMLRLAVRWSLHGLPPQQGQPNDCRGRFELPSGQGAQASIVRPQHALLMNDRQLLVAQRYKSEYGGHDNLRLIQLPQRATIDRGQEASVQFDYWLERLPLHRCYKAIDAIKLAVDGGRVYLLLQPSRRDMHGAIEVRDAESGEVTQRIEIDGHALDFALGADVEHREFVLLESPRLPVRHDYSLRVVVYYGEDGRRLREWSLPPACPMDGCFQPGCCNHEFLAVLENLVFTARFHTLTVHSSEGTLLRSWDATSADPSGWPCYLTGLCVDPHVVFATRGNDVLAFSHSGQLLHGISIGNGPRRSSVQGMSNQRLSISYRLVDQRTAADGYTCVCIADEEANVVYCVGFLS